MAKRKKETSALSTYEDFIHLSRYARWKPEENRRETYNETVKRYIDFFRERFEDKIDKEVWQELYGSILSKEVMPSMRALMTAGPALARDNVAGYNCSYLAIDNQDAFAEAMYILMCGTGVGFSVEKAYVDQLPVVPSSFDHDAVIVVEDSKRGWSTAFKRLIDCLYEGNVPRVNYDLVRPAGERLKTFGGQASGPAPLKKLVNFTIKTFTESGGRRLTPLECHDIMCMIGDVVVCGGVRRSALISLSDIEDREMQSAKSGEWYVNHTYRALANNSAVYTNDMGDNQFWDEWTALKESGSGERGIFSRDAVSIPERRELSDFGTNPCSEIVLRNKQFCNLTEVVVREDDTEETLARKVRNATILGTLQSTLDDLSFLSEDWAKNTKEERLLGVSMTGICDNAFTSTPTEKLAGMLQRLRDYAVEVNEITAKALDIEPSKAITCVKPSGTVSQLVNAASGIHPRYSEFYIRRVRMDSKDPLCQWMQNQGVPFEKDFYGESNIVFSFPVRSPDRSVFRDDRTAIEQLELWKLYQQNWCEHKPSVTIYVSEDEWDIVGQWVKENLSIISGVSFLPKGDDDHTYVQAPYEEIDEDRFYELVKEMPTVNFSRYTEFADMTTASQELACTGGVCEVV